MEFSPNFQFKSGCFAKIPSAVVKVTNPPTFFPIPDIQCDRQRMDRPLHFGRPITYIGQRLRRVVLDPPYIPSTVLRGMRVGHADASL